MNLRAAANALTRSVNPNVLAQIQRSNGYETLPNLRQLPDYADPQTITVQQQALTTEEIKHLDSLNIQGTMSGFWVDGQVRAGERRTGAGGDLLLVGDETWLVVAVLEDWRQSGWSHVAGQLQDDTP